MNYKPTILIFIDWFWPGYLAGGPVQSIVSIVNHLQSDFNFKIITTNCDLNSKTPYPDIVPNQWVASPLGCEVFYAEPHKINAELITKLLHETTFDGVYINSFFSKNFSILPLQILNKTFKHKPVILAPRGMLGSGALAIKKIKKQLFILYARLSGLHSNIIWHSTSSQESAEIKHVFSAAKSIVQISNLPKKLSAPAHKEKNTGTLNLCFVSRISEKKNLLFAIQVLSKINAVAINFSIYGPLEDELYWQKCEALIKTLPNNIHASYNGSVAPKDIERVYATQHLMFLPTLNENFGHSIVESLMCGCPVIISDQTPWNDLENYQAGYALPLSSPEIFAEKIIAFANLTQNEYSQKSTAAIGYIREKINLDLIINQYKKLFNECIKN
ncbi:MAG: glycosyltransferase [Bacteroidia bacterium]|nr:glycosyltransferase [Bacteroidia bacterium]